MTIMTWDVMGYLETLCRPKRNMRQASVWTKPGKLLAAEYEHTASQDSRSEYCLTRSFLVLIRERPKPTQGGFPTSSVHICLFRKHLQINIFAFPKNQTLSFFMILRASGNVEGPMHPLFLTLNPPNHSKQFKKCTKSVWRIMFLEIRQSRKSTIPKNTCAENARYSYNKNSKLLNTESISLKKP